MSTPVPQTVPRLDVTTPDEREIRIERVFAAPRERVWRAFTSLFLTAEERGGMLSSGMRGGLEQSCAALDRLLADGG